MILQQFKTTTTNPANIDSAILTVFSQSNDGATQEVHGTIRITNRSSSALTNLTVVIDKPTRYGEQTVQVNGVSSIEIPLSPILWRAGETLTVSLQSNNAGDNATTVVCDFFNVVSVPNSAGVNTLLDRITALLQTKAQADADQATLVSEINANETKIDGIKAKTDQLEFTAGNVHADAKVVSTKEIQY
jgi:hypothetical protein